MKIELGVAYYRREEKLRQLISSFNQQNVINRLVIIDDSGQDYNELDFNCNVKSIKYVKNDRNLGYASTFIKIFHESVAEYIIYSADDDILLEKDLDNLLCYLKSSDVSVLSTLYMRDGIKRRVLSNGVFSPSKLLQATMHSPGLVFRRESVMPYLHILQRKINMKDPIALLYPQVLLVIMMYNDHLCEFRSFDLITDNNNQPSNLCIPSSGSYESIISRFEQGAGFLRASAYLLPEFRNRFESSVVELYIKLIYESSSFGPNKNFGLVYRLYSYFARKLLKSFFKKVFVHGA